MIKKDSQETVSAAKYIADSDGAKVQIHISDDEKSKSVKMQS